MGLSLIKYLKGFFIIKPIIKFKTESEAVAKQKLMSIYDSKKQDWMGYSVSKKNPLKYHYIEETIGGINIHCETMHETGALITKKAKKDLAILKTFEPGLYEEINYLLGIINQIGRNYPDQGYQIPTEIQNIMHNAVKRMHEAFGLVAENRIGRSK